MTLSEAINKIEKLKQEASQESDRADPDGEAFMLGRFEALDDALWILADVRPGSGLDEALNSGDGSYRP
jgi:hypothetical protein